MNMILVSHPRADELRAELVNLAKACPVDQCNPEDCPLFTLRQMEVEERMRWVNALEEDDLVYLATYHHVCLAIRLHCGLAGTGG